MALKKSHWTGIISALAILIICAVLLYLKVVWFNMKMFYFIAGIAIVIGGLPFFLSLLLEARREKSVDMMFLEFTRDLVEGVRAGTPISKSILNLRTKNYGGLQEYVDKLANQIALGIPVKDALDTFAKDIKSPVISRAVSLIREAEVAGGKIESILESVSYSVSQIEKLKKERQAAISSLAVQGYIIFLIFIAIMLVMEFQILPLTMNMDITGAGGSSTVSDLGLGGIGGTMTTSTSAEDFVKPFLFLIITQGFFAGLIIGKISEGTVKAGLKHSFVLVALSWIISTGANLMF